MESKRIALKYCGGCDPGFDRTDYVRSIKNAAGARVQWVTLNEDPLNAILLVNGCFSACAWKAVDSKSNISVVSVCDGELSPENIVKILIKNEGRNEDQDQRGLHTESQGPESRNIL